MFAQVGNEFDQEFRHKLGERYFTFRAALNLLNPLIQTNQFINILQTGCVRQSEDWGAGMSSYVFMYLLRNYTSSGMLTSVDISDENLTKERIVLQEKFGPSIDLDLHLTQVRNDSHDALRNFTDQILNSQRSGFDLIYLDSYDACLEDRLSNNLAQEHQLKEAKFAVECFGDDLPWKILLLDDNHLPWGGKTRLTKEFLFSEGWTCVLDHQQSLWIKAD